MLTLIKRELREFGVIFIVAPLILFFAFVITISASTIIHNEVEYNKFPPLGLPENMVTVFQFVVFLLPVISTLFGAGQMYSDRNKKISTFLVTLATDRRRILIAKLIIGVISILASICLFVITDAVLLRIVPRLIPLDTGFITRMISLALVLNLAGYSVGLSMGWGEGRLLRFVGSLLITILLMTIVIYKGLSLETLSILAILALAFFIRTWQRFMSTSL
ncbi:MAG: hypothetical protein WC975_06605 [Phycisphaerae bacterium]